VFGLQFFAFLHDGEATGQAGRFRQSVDES
jgi:hypothetical protein